MTNFSLVYLVEFLLVTTTTVVMTTQSIKKRNVQRNGCRVHHNDITWSHDHHMIVTRSGFTCEIVILPVDSLSCEFEIEVDTRDQS